MKSKEIRKQFLSFFESKSHKIVQSAPMVQKDDPTLMFTNAGMVPFKSFFLGDATASNVRIANTQKCLRVSGKHNDLEEVGYDTYHHTMFEMLGNWSFGDYFKKQAICWSWELLTEVYGIDPSDLYITVFEGSTDKDNLSLDRESYDYWCDIVPEDRIIKGNKKDNFWEMGEQGPCGPCSEIHIDIRSKSEKQKVAGSTLINKDHPQVIEIWNLVFIQYNRKSDGSLEPLPKKHVDTGMGFERLCMIIQGVKSSYDTDVFKSLIREVETITETTYGEKQEIDVAIRVVVDHVRAVCFAIADGQLPSNTGAGYVIRRILRRAIRYGFTFLGQKEPFIYKLTSTLSHQIRGVFPEIRAQESMIQNVIKQEENSFLRTLSQGLLLLDNIISSSTENIISGRKAFELYDTYGFPLDLTQLISKERGYIIDEAGFYSEMKKQKDRSRLASSTKTGDWITLQEDDEEEFVGYDILEVNVRITRYREVITKKGQRQYQLIFNMTPFYPESGGQVGDRGYLEVPNGDVIYITDTKKQNDVIIHFAKTLPKHLTDTFKAVVDKKYRYLTSSNHSATHLLHQGLRTILGEHVEQKGSLVHPDYLRFDFSHFSKLDKSELQAVEDFVNARIRENIPLQEKRNVPMQQAIGQGAIALFGEKYSETVRTIKFGQSLELCGGTHVKQTGDIWYFKIRSESSIASGIRRIEAITNISVGTYFEQVEDQFIKIKSMLKNPGEPIKAILNLQDENTAVKRELAQLLEEKAQSLKTQIEDELEEIQGVLFLSKKISLDQNGIKNIAFELGKKHKNLFLLFATSISGKVMLTCYISKELATERNYDAGRVVRELGKFIHGGGGGQPFFATAGGRNPAGITTALEKAKDYL